MALNIKIVLLVILGGAIALFLIQNVANVEIQFMFWSVMMRRSTLVLLVLGIGVVVGWVFHGIHARTHRRRTPERHAGDGKEAFESAPNKPVEIGRARRADRSVDE